MRCRISGSFGAHEIPLLVMLFCLFCEVGSSGFAIAGSGFKPTCLVIYASDFDKMIGAEVILPRNGIDMQSGRVVRRVCDDKGRPIGEYNPDPLIDSRVYECLIKTKHCKGRRWC